MKRQQTVVRRVHTALNDTALVGSGAPKKENTKRVNTTGNLKSQKVNQMKISKSFSLP